jgi:hypothetical protein
MKEVMRVVGLALVVLGIFIIIGQPFAPTGAVIDVSDNKARMGFFMGLVLLVGGILFFALGNEGNLEKIANEAPRIVQTSRFKKDIKSEGKKMKQKIYETLEKINTGLGKQERLRLGGQSIRVTNGGRITFDYDSGKNEVTAKRYTPDHDYDKAIG